MLQYVFFNAPATTEIYTLSLHDALPILLYVRVGKRKFLASIFLRALGLWFNQKVDLKALRTDSQLEEAVKNSSFTDEEDRKSTRLNSSHSQISYAVFCLKKKTKTQRNYH